MESLNLIYSLATCASCQWLGSQPDRVGEQKSMSARLQIVMNAHRISERTKKCVFFHISTQSCKQHVAIIKAARWVTKQIVGDQMYIKQPCTETFIYLDTKSASTQDILICDVCYTSKTPLIQTGLRPLCQWRIASLLHVFHPQSRWQCGN